VERKLWHSSSSFHLLLSSPSSPAARSRPPTSSTALVSGERLLFIVLCRWTCYFLKREFLFQNRIATFSWDQFIRRTFQRWSALVVFYQSVSNCKMFRKNSNIREYISSIDIKMFAWKNIILVQSSRREQLKIKCCDLNFAYKEKNSPVYRNLHAVFINHNCMRYLAFVYIIVLSSL